MPDAESTLRTILARWPKSPLPALATKVSIRRAWNVCKLTLSEATKKSSTDDKTPDEADPDDEVDPSARRAALGEFRKRHRYSVPMRHQPGGKLFAKTSVWHGGHNLNTNVPSARKTRVAMPQSQRRVVHTWPGFDTRSNPSVRTRTLDTEKVAMAQGSVLKLKRPTLHNQYHKCHASFLAFLTFALTRRLEPEHEDPLVRLLVGNHEGTTGKSVTFVFEPRSKPALFFTEHSSRVL